MTQTTRRLVLVLLALRVLVGAPLSAIVYEIFPSDANQTCDEEFENLANSLLPGDELVLHGGVYTQSCRRAIRVNGTETMPILIRAADGERPILTRPTDNIDLHNNIEIEDSSWVTLRGLTFEGGSTGVRFIRGNDVSFIGNEIRNTGNNALSMNSGDCKRFVLRRNHIHRTGLSDSGPTEGEGMYVGCNNDACRTTDSRIEGNYIHHLRATSSGGNDGIEVKPGSHGNIIRHNVIHDTNIGTEYPCIFVYGGGDGRNIVDGNALWNCGEAIQVVSDAVIENNLILNSSIHGITAAPHAQVSGIRDVTIVNNTIYGHPKCLQIRWSGATGTTLANNAVYCPGGTAVDASGLTEAGVTVRSNYVEGALVGAILDADGFFDGGMSADAFVDPSHGDFWPGVNSPLLQVADPGAASQRDFNLKLRSGPIDVGAYEADQMETNPCWKPQPGFKQPCSPAGSRGAETPPPPFLRSIPDGTWTEIPNSGMLTAGPQDIGCCDFGAPCELQWGGILAFSGATLDRIGRRILLWGGGHNDYFGNQLLSFELDALAWRLETDPTSLCEYGPVPDYAFVDGTPVARHTYDHVDFIEELGLLFSFSGSTSDQAPYNSGTSYGDLWTYDFASKAWRDHTQSVSGGNDFELIQPGNSGEFDPLTKRWYQLTSSGVWALDFSSRQWLQMTDVGPPGIERTSVLDTQRRRIWSYGGVYGGGSTLSYYDIDSNRFVVVSSLNAPGARSAVGLAYDSANDDLVLYGGGTDTSVWNYDIDSSTWTEFARANAPVSRQTYGRFLYDDILNLFFLIPSVDSVWVWRNTQGVSAERLP